MTFKLLWSIVRTNFKKNWVMILSFFAFLIVSFSIVFGLTSYAVGLHNEMPEQVFQSQKYETRFSTSQVYESQQDGFDDQVGAYPRLTYTDNTTKLIQADFESFLTSDEKKINPNDTKNNAKTIEEVIKVILNKYNGNLSWYIDNYYPKSNSEHEVKTFYDVLVKVQSSLLDETGNANIAAYTLSKDIFPTLFKGMDIWQWQSTWSKQIGLDQSARYYILNKNNDYQKELIDTGIYQTKKYVNTENVVFLSPDAEKKYNYKLGQKIDISFNGTGETGWKQEGFTYGGTAGFIPTMSQTRYKSTYSYYIMNYKKSNDSKDLRTTVGNSRVTYLITDPYVKNNKKEQKQSIISLAQGTNGFLEKEYITHPKPKSGLNSETFELPTDGAFQQDDIIFGTYIVYIGMTMFSLIVGILMLVLDIVVSIFLIREIIRSLGTTLLFLKTLGMSNNEASLITTTTLFIVMAVSICLALIGTLGIQALFINITSGFLVDLNVWSSIKLFTLVIIFGTVIVMLIAYMISTMVMLKNIDLTSTSVFSKSGASFGKLRGHLFNVSVNGGLSFSFAMKNLKKIIATFCITLLVTMLSFIALGFKTSVDKGMSDAKSFVFNKDTMSWNKNDGFINKAVRPYEPQRFNADTAQRTINYIDQGLDESNRVVVPDKLDISKIKDIDLNNKYITSDDFSKLINNPIARMGARAKLGINGKEFDAMKVKWNNFVESYKERIHDTYPGEDDSFVIDFGSLFTKGASKEIAYQLNLYVTQNDYREMHLIVLDDNDKRAKEIFKSNDEYSMGQLSDDSIKSDFRDEPILPIAVSPQLMHSYQLDEGDLSWDSNIDFHIGGGYYWENKKLNPVWDSGGLWPNRDKLKLKMRSATSIKDSNEAYVKKSDFLKFLEFCRETGANYANDTYNGKPWNNATDFFTYLENLINKGEAYNTFLNNGVPIGYKQLVVPRTYAWFLKSNLSSKGCTDSNCPMKGCSDMSCPNDNCQKGNCLNGGCLSKCKITLDDVNLLEGTTTSYLLRMADMMSNPMVFLNNTEISYYKLEINENQGLLNPIENAMIVLLILIICLAVAFIVFMVMSIMNENDDIVFIMKALGYSKSEILWKMISGYLISILISVIAGTIVAGVILSIMNGTFIQILYLPIGLTFSAPIIGLFLALIIGLPLCITLIATQRIEARNLTEIDRQ